VAVTLIVVVNLQYFYKSVASVRLVDHVYNAYTVERGKKFTKYSNLYSLGRNFAEEFWFLEYYSDGAAAMR